MCVLSLFAWQGFAQSPAVIYDGTAGTLPSAQGWTESKLDQLVNPIAAPITVAAANGALKFASTNAANQFSQLQYYKTDVGFDLATGFTIELKAKILSADKTGAFNIQGVDKSGAGFRIGILADKLTELTDPLSATRILASDLENDDGFHIYKFVFTSGGVAAVFRDGTLVGTFQMVIYSFDNIIENGGFEDPEIPDFTSNGVITRISKTDAPKKVRTGNYGLELYNNGLVTNGWTDIENARTRDIAVKPETDYELRLDRRRSLNDDTWCWRDGGMFYNGQKGTLDGADERTTNITWLSFGWMWQTHPQDFKTPALSDGTQSVRLEFPTWLKDGKNQNRTSFDNVILREKPVITVGGSSAAVAHGFPAPAPVFPETYTNLIINGDFENDQLNNDGTAFAWAKGTNGNEPNSFNSVWGGLVRLQTGSKTDETLVGSWRHGGNNSVRWTTMQSKANILDFKVTLEANKTYRFNFWVEIPQWGETGWLKAKINGTADNLDGGTEIWARDLIPGDVNSLGWLNPDMVFTTTDENYVLHLYSRGDDHCCDWWNLYFDDFVLYEVTADQPVPVDPVIAGKTNLIANGDFEDATVDNAGNPYVWALASGDRKGASDNYPVAYNSAWGASVRLQDVRKGDDTGPQWAHSGTKSVRVSYLDDDGQARIFEGLSGDELPEHWRTNINFKKELEANKTYTMIFWLKAANYADNGKLSIANGDIKIWDETLNRKYNDWVRHQITFSTTPASHTLRMYTEFTGWFNFYLDDFFLFEEETYQPSLAPTYSGGTYLAFGKSAGTSSVDVEVEYVKLDVTGSYLFSCTFVSNGGSDVPPQIVSGQVLKPEDPTREGFDFAGWYTDALLTTPFDFDSPLTSDIVLFAKWTVQTFTVTFDTGEGSAVDPQTIVYNLQATEPTPPTRTGFDFAGWYIDDQFTTAYDFQSLVTTDITLYAKWTVASFDVIFNTNGGSPVETQSITWNEPATEPADPKRAGYIFAGWYGDEELTTAFDFETPIVAVTTVYAKWTADETYKTTFFVDFGRTDRGATTDGVDKNGNVWNNITGPNGSAQTNLDPTTIPLVTSQGTAAGVTLALKRTIGANGTTGSGGLANPDPELLGDLAIESATIDYFFLDGNDGRFSITGLDPTKFYEVTIFGTRIGGSDGRAAIYSLYGLNGSHGTLVNGDNTGNVWISEPVKPTAAGEIYLAVGRLEDSKMAYIGAMKIEETEGETPEATAKFFIDFGRNDGAQGLLTEGADANGNYWNNVYSVGSSMTAIFANPTTLLSSTGAGSDYTLQVIENGYEFNGLENGGCGSPDAALGDLAIATATRDYIFKNNGNVELQFNHLNVESQYRFHIFGSRADASDNGRVERIKLEGATSVIGVHQVGGKAIGAAGGDGNDSRVFISKFITPKADSTILLTAEKWLGAFTHINAVKVEELGTGQSGVSTPEAAYSLKVFSVNKVLTITVNVPSLVSVYNSVGALIAHVQVESLKTINLPVGVYLVKAISENGDVKTVKALNR
jgi:uncharacterized repeat protein (TIGR02543 family)